MRRCPAAPAAGAAFAAAALVAFSPAASGARAPRPPSGGRYVVPLHRHRTPVRSDGTDLISFKNTYFGTVTVGAHEPQAFDVVFDTGSGQLIVPDSRCSSAPCLTHRRYDREASPHAVDVDHDGTPVPMGAPRDQITIAFGTGEVTGQFVHDQLCLGPSGRAGPARRPRAEARARSAGSDFGQVLLQKRQEVLKRPPVGDDEEDGGDEEGGAELNCVGLRVVTAVEMSDDPFSTFAFDGVLGLGLEGLSLTPEFNPFGMLAAGAPLAQASFGVFLADGDEERSELSVGGHSPELVWGEPAFAPVVTPDLGYWQVQITALRVGNRTVDFCADGRCRAVVDTGTSLLAVPKGFADELQLELEGALADPGADPAAAPGEGVDCRRATGTSVHFDIDGYTVTLGPGDYSRQSVQFREDDAEGPVFRPVDVPSGSDGESTRSCWPAIMPVDFSEPMGPKLFIWGEPVLRKYYTVYNWREKSVGFGLARHLADSTGGAPAPERRRGPLLEVLLEDLREPDRGPA